MTLHFNKPGVSPQAITKRPFRPINLRSGPDIHRDPILKVDISIEVKKRVKDPQPSLHSFADFAVKKKSKFNFSASSVNWKTNEKHLI